MTVTDSHEDDADGGVPFAHRSGHAALHLNATSASAVKLPATRSTVIAVGFSDVYSCFGGRCNVRRRLLWSACCVCVCALAFVSGYFRCSNLRLCFSIKCEIFVIFSNNFTYVSVVQRIIGISIIIIIIIIKHM